MLICPHQHFLCLEHISIGYFRITTNNPFFWSCFLPLLVVGKSKKSLKKVLFLGILLICIDTYVQMCTCVKEM